jgi:acyl carrier protein
MIELDRKLTRCFLAVFPGLRDADVPRATMESVEAWDSIASVVLLTAVCEEFDLPLDFEAVETLNSYSAIRDYVASPPESTEG